ncbi:sulfite exporter TauE/SafE family protein [uncultured Corynebacterium sp.]|uniref:sulfite exporter TauE/SafE family protein n=1 Tax=uncultured Corynebacterium sp. TaxID=159447 RepID=UPI00261F473F|nr:sulfite exporter TauE/SafE family protein [uncultured Corynebacterium sp.]
MEKILLFVLIGLGAQLVDGTLGMAFGVTATTLFILSGTGAATASAVVHVVEVGTTFVSGISHWRFGNVDWGRVLRLGVPGAVGAFVGATFLSNLDGDAATPVTSSILLGLGLWVLVRFAFLGGGRVTAAKRWGVRKLAPLGLVGGLLDSTGGGGWGPVTTSGMRGAGEEQLVNNIGTVSVAEFCIAVCAVLGFLPMLRDEFAAHTLPIVGLLAGGIVAAPLAAFLVGRINPRLLGIVIGGVLVSLNLRTLLSDVVPGGVLAAVIVAWVVLVAAILGWAVRHDELPWRRRRVELAEEREPARVA